jgi:hypothetical protein
MRDEEKREPQSLTHEDKKGSTFMSKYGKTFVWVLGGIAGFIAILIVFLLALPTLIDLGPIKEKIAAEISKKIGGEFETQTIDLLFFPRPRIQFHQGRVAIPEKVSGTFRSLTIYPKFLRLLMGNLEVVRLNVEKPEVRMGLPGELKGGNEGLKTLSLKTMEEKVSPFLAHLMSKMPGLVVAVEKGNLHLVGQDQSLFKVHDVHARIGLDPKRVTLEMSCGSDRWENLSLQGWLRPKGYKGQGHLELIQFHPGMLTGLLFPHTTPHIKDFEADVDLKFSLNGPKEFTIDGEASIPSLTLEKGRESLTIKNTRLRGEARREKEKTILALNELNISYPSMWMSGKLSIEPVSPLVSLEISSRGVDVASLRETVLFLIGKKIPVAQTLFEILREGKIPRMTLSAHGPSIDELGKEKNLTVQGSLIDGKVFIPEGALHLEDVKGNAIISRGLLEGKNLEAKLGNSHARNGSLRLGLKGEETPLHLDVIIKADLAQLLPHLRHFLKGDVFKREIAMVQDLHGSATGRMILDQRIENTEVNVDIWDLNLHGVYQRLPYPVEIHGGKASLNTAEATVNLENLTGKFGKSTFSQLTAEVAWEKETYLDVTSLRSKIVLEEIQSWVQSFESLEGLLKKARFTKGTVILDGELRGPISRPRRWNFRLKGEAENVSVQWAALPGEMNIRKGKFEAIPERLSFTDVHVGALDAALIVSGVLDHYLEELGRIDLNLRGEIGQGGVQRIYDFISVPSEVRIRAPLSFSEAHLHWGKKGLTSFSGSFDVRRGPKVSIDLFHRSEELFVKQLTVQDETSDASITLHLKRKEVDLSFSGRLTKATLDGLLTKNRFLSGWIEGKFRTQILLDQPTHSMAQGHVKAAGLDYSWKAGEPFRIETLSLEAERNRVTVQSAHVRWGKSLLTLSGEVNFPDEAFFLDMDLSVDHVDLDEFLGKVPGKKGAKGGPNFWGMPLKGTLRFKTRDLKYGGFTWHPVRAEITGSPQRVNIAVQEASLCGIDTPGVIEVFPEGFQIHFEATAKDQPLASALLCLWNERDIQGQFDFAAEITGQGKKEELARSVRGNLHFVAKDGRIYRFGLLAKIFAVLNVTEILRGKLPDLVKEGFAYHAMEMKGRLQDGKLIFEEAVIDGSAMDIVCEGAIDPAGKKIDLTVLVAPFKTIDRIIRTIPLVGYLLGGKLVSIPVRVTGDLEDPTVIPFSPSAVGSGLIEMMKRTLHIPFKIIQPLLPEEQEKGSP